MNQKVAKVAKCRIWVVTVWTKDLRTSRPAFAKSKAPEIMQMMLRQKKRLLWKRKLWHLSPRGFTFIDKWVTRTIRASNNSKRKQLVLRHTPKNQRETTDNDPYRKNLTCFYQTPWTKYKVSINMRRGRRGKVLSMASPVFPKPTCKGSRTKLNKPRLTAEMSRGKAKLTRPIRRKGSQRVSSDFWFLSSRKQTSGLLNRIDFLMVLKVLPLVETALLELLTKGG